MWIPPYDEWLARILELQAVYRRLRRLHTGISIHRRHLTSVFEWRTMTGDWKNIATAHEWNAFPSSFKSSLTYHFVSLPGRFLCFFEQDWSLRGPAASWLVRSFSDRAALVRALAGYIALCSWARHFTLTVPLSTQVYKLVLAKCWGNLTNCRGVACDGLASCPGEVTTETGLSCGRPTYCI